MKKSMTLVGVVVVSLCTPFAVYSLSQATAAAQKPADAQTIKVVTAAQAFLGTLTEAQKKTVSFAFTDTAQRTRWSNFPQGAFNRVGLGWGKMTATQRTALMNLLGSVLSAQGVQNIKDQMAGDDVVFARDNAGGKKPPGGGPPPNDGNGGGPPPNGGGQLSINFGSDYYYVSFVGAPSTTSPWMLQFGGHHLAINATVVGADITLSPSLTGGQPVKASKDSKGITFAENEMKQSFVMLGSLDKAQLAKAVISSSAIDLVLGPGQDSKVLQPEGLPGSAMTAAQKTQFLALIKDRLGMLNSDDLSQKMTDVQKNLEKTYFAWWGPTTAGSAGYFRVTGPTVLIEFSPQSNDGDATDHAHNMYRDPSNDYGAAWAKLK